MRALGCISYSEIHILRAAYLPGIIRVMGGTRAAVSQGLRLRWCLDARVRASAQGRGVVQGSRCVHRCMKRSVYAMIVVLIQGISRDDGSERRVAAAKCLCIAGPISGEHPLNAKDEQRRTGGQFAVASHPTATPAAIGRGQGRPADAFPAEDIARAWACASLSQYLCRRRRSGVCLRTTTSGGHPYHRRPLSGSGAHPRQPWVCRCTAAGAPGAGTVWSSASPGWRMRGQSLLLWRSLVGVNRACAQSGTRARAQYVCWRKRLMRVAAGEDVSEACRTALTT